MCSAPSKSAALAPPPQYSGAPGSSHILTTAPAEKMQSQLQTGSEFKTAIPLILLRQYPAPVDCPVCGQRNVTKSKYVVGGFTHLMALALFTTVVFVWIPYALKGCKNVEHRCGNPDCKALLATFHRTFSPGDIEVHKFN